MKRTTGARAGIVGYHLRGTASKGSLTPARMIQVIEAGLSIAELDALRASLDLPMDRLATLLGISRATLHRRRAEGRLDREESDRVVRFARLMGRAVEVLESEEAARRWLNAPQVGLGGAVPLDFAVTEVGAREVEDLLGRIEYGVYS
jgi:putative toxin-antitoxin system antitoxin component (TIGR02293 family)